MFLNDKLIKNFQEISFDKLYYAYHIPYSPQAPFVGGFLRFNYISLSDDGQYYQTHIIHTVRLNVDNHTGHEYALLINTLIQDYHEKHGLQGKVPKITFIQQR